MTAAPQSTAATAGDGRLEELVVCSLEPWDEIWRRNQFIADRLLERNALLRILFVEPPTDPIHALSHRRRPRLPRLRTVGYGGRLRALRPVKPLPRRVGPLADLALQTQVRLAARALRFSRPTLWINDVTYAPLIKHAGWPTVYDVTDDWLAAPFPPRELMRLRKLEQVALHEAQAVTVCSEVLARSKGETRPVVVIPNAVDFDHFSRPRPRPVDLPPSPVAVYVGTLHESRIDVDLVVELSRALPRLRLALVGPDAISDRSRRTLRATPNVALIGSRHYEDVPAYLQHADVIVIPHLVNAFTDSLDPIKAYECAAVSRPVVSTPIAGFRGVGGSIAVADRNQFIEAVKSVLESGRATPSSVPSHPPSWKERAEEFAGVLGRVTGGAA
jgi:glycosyltransferase involved in cell wall biosynthesis